LPARQLRVLDIDIDIDPDTSSTRPRISLRATSMITKLSSEPVHLDLELGKLATFSIQPVR
jgi:hypothetical protein